MNPTLPYQPPIQPSIPPQQPAAPQHNTKKRWLWSLGVVVVIMTVLVGALVFITASTTTADAITGQVTIDGNGFTPATISIKKGQTVTWSNQDRRSHQVTADQPNVLQLDSQEALATGDGYSFTFESAGSFSYHDPLSSTGFKGTVIVE
jgi:plastocyanin